MREAWHQLDPVEMSQKEFDELPFREDVEGEHYKDGELYRARNYPEEVFVWVAYEKGAPTKGEWQMAAVEID